MLINYRPAEKAGYNSRRHRKAGECRTQVEQAQVNKPVFNSVLNSCIVT